MNKKGVTLLELIIVMVIIAIGATLLVPGIGAWIPIYRLKGATRDVVSTMRTAQMKAVSTNMEYRVSLNGATESYILQYKNTMGNWVDEGDIQTLPKGIEIDGNAVFNAEFNPNSTSSSGSVTLKNPKNSTRKIVLHYTGRIRVEPPL